MDKDIPKINCTTVITWRNTRTGETFDKKVEGPDIVQDVTVTVSPKGLSVLQKVMSQANEDKKSKP